MVVLAACASGDSDDPTISPPQNTVTTAAPPTSAPAPASSPRAATPGCPTGVGAGPADAQQAARCLYAAWKASDRSAAAVVASADVVDSLFRQRWSPPDATFPPCTSDPVTGSELCRYDHHEGTYLVDVRRSEGGWRVVQVQGPLQGE